LNITTHGKHPKVTFLAAEKRALANALAILKTISEMPIDLSAPADVARAGLEDFIEAMDHGPVTTEKAPY
jgi:hypothetical protein